MAYSGKNRLNKREPDSKQMAVTPECLEKATENKGDKEMPGLKDSNYGHNRGVKFDSITENQAWPGNQIPEIPK